MREFIKNSLVKLLSRFGFYSRFCTLKSIDKSILYGGGHPQKVEFSEKEFNFLYDVQIKSPNSNDYSCGFLRNMPHIFSLNDVDLVGRFGIVVSREKILIESTFSAYRAQAVIRRFFLNRRRKLNYPSFAFYHFPWAESNIYHWVTEVLPRLIIFFKYFEKELSSVRFILPYKSSIILEEVVLPILKYHGIPKEHILRIKKSETWHLKKLYFVPFVTKDENPYLPKLLVPILQKTIFDSLSIKRKGVQYKGIYISRKFAKKRRIINEVEIILALQKMNIEIVIAENLSYSEQIAKFHNSPIIIGAHGAGLTNIIFSQKGSHIIEFHPLDTPKSHYMLLSKSCDHYYHPVLGSTEGQNGDFYIELKELSKIINLII